MMSYVYLVLLLAISYANADDMRSCITDDTCEEGECCISMGGFFRGFCQDLGSEGDHCIMEPAETRYGKKNIFGCPCKEGLKCIPEIVKEEAGRTVMKNFACKKTE